MHEIERWIDEATQQGLLIKKLPQEEAKSVHWEVTTRYVKTNSPCTWWEHLKRPIDEYYDRKTVKLLNVIWFVLADSRHRNGMVAGL